MQAFIKDEKVASLILNNPGLGVIFVNENDVVEYCNEEARTKLSGGENITGRGVEECHPPHLKKKVKSILDSFRQGNNKKIRKTVNTGKFHIKNVYTPVFDEQDKYRGMVVTIQMNS